MYESALCSLGVQESSQRTITAFGLLVTTGMTVFRSLTSHLNRCSRRTLSGQVVPTASIAQQ